MGIWSKRKCSWLGGKKSWIRKIRSIRIYWMLGNSAKMKFPYIVIHIILGKHLMLTHWINQNRLNENVFVCLFVFLIWNKKWVNYIGSKTWKKLWLKAREYQIYIWMGHGKYNLRSYLYLFEIYWSVVDLFCSSISPQIPLPQMMAITLRLELCLSLRNYTSELHAWDLECKSRSLVGSSKCQWFRRTGLWM